jgi:hypothetical protein
MTDISSNEKMAVGSWQLAVGSWQLAVGSWQYKNRAFFSFSLSTAN